MISFRFHVVSLIAVFLAIGLGVVTGTTVLNNGIVAQLEDRTDQISSEADRLREDVETLEAFGQEAVDHLIRGRLLGDRVVLVTQEGTENNGVDGAIGAIETAGAQLEAVLSIEDRMVLGGEAEREELAAAIGADPSAEDLPEQAAAALADRLVTGPSVPDVLAALLDAGFVSTRAPGPDGESLAELGGDGVAVLVVAGGDEGPPLPVEDFLVPFVARLATDGGMVAAAETRRSGFPFVGLLRDDGDIADRIVTLDNVDEIPGEVGLVLALEDLLDEGQTGHYGVKDGATGLMPTP